MGIKQTVFTALTAVALMGTGVSLTGTAPESQAHASTSTQQANDSGQLLINYKPGYSIAVWNSPDSNRRVTGKYLKHGTQVNYNATDRNSNGGIVWYQIGQNEWIQSAYTAAFASLVNTNMRSLTIDYVPGYSIAVWNSPLNGRKALPKKLKNGTTWKVFSGAQVGQDQWYNLGGNQWVSVHYIHPNYTK